MSTIHISEAKINVYPDMSNGLRTATLWGVRGIEYGMYPSKLAAEVAARVQFPREDPDTRYARIFSREFIDESSM